MRITALTENTTCRTDVGAEHGLSLYIETAGHRILFDMGQSELFLRNAAVLGVDLQQVELAVLSHGHYDHGGGLHAFLQANQTAPVYVSRHAFEPHYNGEKYIGLDPLLRDHPRLQFTDEVHPIAPGITLFSCNEKERRHPLSGGRLTVERDGVRRAEDFRHEQVLLIEDEGKRVLVSGCSHKGIVNLVEWFAPDVLVGGFHLSPLPCGRELTAIAEQLAAYPTHYFTCHCTGTEQYQWIKNSLPRLDYLAAGDRIEI